jgi:hypothetical protein
MTAPVPTNEPFQARAGTTWTWQRQNLSDYPASAWTLKYAFKNAVAHFELTATASGDWYTATIAAATTLGYEPGKYRWVAWVESGMEKYEVDTGWLEVLPPYNQATQAARDDRTHARRTLDAIEAVIENRATVDQMEYTIGNRHLKRMPVADLMKWRDYYRDQVFAEEANERIRNGYGASRLVAKL